MASKSQPVRHSLPPKPQVNIPVSTPSEEPHRAIRSMTDGHERTSTMQADIVSPLSLDTASRMNGVHQQRGLFRSFSSTSLTPGLTTGSSSFASLHGDLSPLTTTSAMTPWWQAGYLDSNASSYDANPIRAMASTPALPLPQTLSRHGSSRSMTEITHLTDAFSGMTVSQHKFPAPNLSGSRIVSSDSMPILPSEGRAPAPLLIPMEPTGAGLPLTSVVETLASKGSRAAAENPETVAAAYTLSQWGIGIGPGINPKIVSSRRGDQSRAKTPSTEPPIVNTGNSGPMCVQPGDWICTACGFVNWRRRKVCMRCYPFAEGNEVCQGIHGGEELAKRLAAGLDPNTEEYKQSINALYKERPKRATEANPHHYQSNGFLQSSSQTPTRDMGLYFGHTIDRMSVPPTPNLLGIHLEGEPYSLPLGQIAYTEQDQGSMHRNSLHAYKKQHSISWGTSSPDAPRHMNFVGRNSRSNGFDVTPSEVQHLTSMDPPVSETVSPQPPRSIWAPAPRRPVPVPMDPETVATKDRRARLEPIGTKTSTQTSSNSNANKTNDSPEARLEIGAPGSNSTLDNREISANKQNDRNSMRTMENFHSYTSWPIASSSSSSSTSPPLP